MQPHPLADDIFKLIAESCKDSGMEAYIIGGYVRDFFLRRQSTDIDVVVIGDGINAAKILADKIPGSHYAFFKNFGTAMVKTDDYEIEFVGARKESYNKNSRKPLVALGTLADDQLRRDFTINALALSLNDSNYGELIDPFNGIQDLNDKIIRTPDDADTTYSDDPLRMMRAIRFASQLNFQIEKKSFEAIKRNAERIKIVSQERITDELNKIILSDLPSVGFKLLFDSGLLQFIFPQFTALHGVEYVNGKGHKDNFYHTLEVLDNISKTTNDLWLRWAAILHDIAKPPTKKFDAESGWTFHGHEDKGARMVPGIFKQLKLPLNDKMKLVQKLVLLHLRPIVLAQDVVTDSAVRRLLFEAGDNIDGLMLLCHADVTTKNDFKKEKYRKNFELVKQKLIEVEEKDRVRNWQPPITGEMIMKTFNLKPSREVGIIKDALREAILDGKIKNDFAQALQFVIEKAKDMGLKPVS